MTQKLEIRTALITGASSGIGRALALWFAQRGVQVFAAARRKSALEDLQTQATAAGGVVNPLEMDVTQTHATVERIQRVDSECGGLDLVIANAGIGVETPAKRIQWNEVEPLLQTNVLGAAATLTAVLPRMVERNRGQIVGISSLAAIRGLPRLSAYSGSKAFLSTFLEGLRVDLKKTNVAVTAIQPGYVKSEMTAKPERSRPFILETEDAADRIGKAIVRRTKVFSFPFQLAVPASMMRFVPAAMYESAIRRMG